MSCGCPSLASGIWVSNLLTIIFCQTAGHVSVDKPGATVDRNIAALTSRASERLNPIMPAFGCSVVGLSGLPEAPTTDAMLMIHPSGPSSCRASVNAKFGTQGTVLRCMIASRSSSFIRISNWSRAMPAFRQNGDIPNLVRQRGQNGIGLRIVGYVQQHARPLTPASADGHRWWPHHRPTITVPIALHRASSSAIAHGRYPR